MPKGWNRTDQGSTTILSAPAPAGVPTVIIRMPPGLDSSGDFRTTFDTAVRQANGNLKVVGGGKVEETTAEEGYEVLFTSLHGIDGTGRWSLRFYMACRPKGRFEMIMYTAPSEEMYTKYQPVLDEFLQSLTFANLKPLQFTYPPQPAPSAALDGFYVTRKAGARNPEYFVFWPDGRVYYGVPRGGLRNFRFEDVAWEEAKNCGFYRITGASIELTWPYEEVKELRNPPAKKIERGENSLRIGGDQFRRVAGEHFLQLAGSFVPRQSPGQVRITFSSDGRFSSEGGFAGRMSGKGTYQITGNTLELRWSEGRTEHYTFFRHPGEEEKQISLDGVSYVRR